VDRGVEKKKQKKKHKCHNQAKDRSKTAVEKRGKEHYYKKNDGDDRTEKVQFLFKTHAM